jgi:hypothetical protein
MLKHATVLAFVFSLAGCGGPEPAEKSSDPPGGDVAKPAVMTDEEFQRKLDEDYGPKQFFKLDELKFADARHGELARRFDAAARELAGADWTHEEYNGRASSRSVAAHWASADREKQKGVEQHAIKIDVQRMPDAPAEILAVGITANYAPATSGWGASVSCFDPRDRVWMQDLRFRIDFRYYPEGEFTWQAPAIEFFKDLEAVALTAQFETTEYHVSVAAHPPTSNSIADDEVLRWLESADALRDMAVGKLDALARQAEKEILEGTAIRDAHLLADGAPRRPSSGGLALAATSPPDTGGPQAVPPPPSLREMTAEERKQVLADALAVIEERKKLIQDNHAEMFAALEKAFPLKECLRGDAN